MLKKSPPPPPPPVLLPDRIFFAKGKGLRNLTAHSACLAKDFPLACSKPLWKSLWTRGTNDEQNAKRKRYQSFDFPDYLLVNFIEINNQLNKTKYPENNKHITYTLQKKKITVYS